MEGIRIDDHTEDNTNNGKWNLVGNPYPSFINANDDADSNASNNFLDACFSNILSELILSSVIISGNKGFEVFALKLHLYGK